MGVFVILGSRRAVVRNVLRTLQECQPLHTSEERTEERTGTVDMIAGYLRAFYCCESLVTEGLGNNGEQMVVGDDESRIIRRRFPK